MVEKRFAEERLLNIPVRSPVLCILCGPAKLVRMLVLARIDGSVGTAAAEKNREGPRAGGAAGFAKLARAAFAVAEISWMHEIPRAKRLRKTQRLLLQAVEKTRLFHW